jgi:murein DD-endopeptidase MepM/ murein hydrolase activator NlpD
VPLRISVTLDPPVVAQGHTLAVRIESSRVCTITGSLQGRPLIFVALGEERYVAWAGVSAMAEIVPQPLHVHAQSADGQSVTLETALNVVPGDYESETLTFTPEVAKLLGPEYTEPELARLAEVYGATSPAVHWQGTFVWPREAAITSAFGSRRRYQGGPWSFHTGIDIRGAVGEPVVAAAAGVVALAEPLAVRGNAVIIDHGAGVLSGYYHLDRIVVNAGQTVAQGELIGEVGSTGLSTGSHLHWELRVGGVAVLPSEWVERTWD